MRWGDFGGGAWCNMTGVLVRRIHLEIDMNPRRLLYEDKRQRSEWCFQNQEMSKTASKPAEAGKINCNRFFLTDIRRKKLCQYLDCELLTSRYLRKKMYVKLPSYHTVFSSITNKLMHMLNAPSSTEKKKCGCSINTNRPSWWCLV